MKSKPKGKFRPGEKVPASGQVRRVGSTTEVTVVQGEPFPPTPAKGGKFVYTDVTKHKEGR